MIYLILVVCANILKFHYSTGLICKIKVCFFIHVKLSNDRINRDYRKIICLNIFILQCKGYNKLQRKIRNSLTRSWRLRLNKQSKTSTNSCLPKTIILKTIKELASLHNLLTVSSFLGQLRIKNCEKFKTTVKCCVFDQVGYLSKLCLIKLTGARAKLTYTSKSALYK